MSAICARGHANPDGSSFCTVCGLALGGPAPAQPGPVPQSAPPATPQYSPTPGYVAPPPAYGTPAPGGFPAAVPSTPRTGFPWKWVGIGVGIAVFVLGAAIVVTNAVGGGTRNVTVSFTVFGVDDCELGLGYFDVPGSSVTIEADGELAGIGTLTQFGDDVGYGCEFSAVVLDVPDDASLYSIEVGRRGVITNTRSELESNGWEFDLSLGN